MPEVASDFGSSQNDDGLAPPMGLRQELTGILAGGGNGHESDWGAQKE